MLKICVASSWKNELQPYIVWLLRKEGYSVYDFRHPPGAKGFSWDEVSMLWEKWTVAEFKKASTAL